MLLLKNFFIVVGVVDDDGLWCNVGPFYIVTPLVVIVCTKFRGHCTDHACQEVRRLTSLSIKPDSVKNGKK